MRSIYLRRAIPAMLAGTMLLSCASCSLLQGTNKKEIVEAADMFASALIKTDADKIIKLTNEKKDGDAAEALDALLSGELYSDDQNEFTKAVADTITYEIDEDSVKSDKDEASVDVTFTMVDYENALKDGEFGDIDEVTDALEDCDDTKEVEITFEFEQDGDDWLITNLRDKDYDELYEFYWYDIGTVIKPDMELLVDYTDKSSGSNYLLFCVYFKENISGYAPDMSFEVYCDSDLIASDLPILCGGDYISCEYSIDEASALPAGSYTIVVYYYGEEFSFGEFTVEEQITETDSAPSSEGVDYNFDVDASGELADYVVAVDWWADDGGYCYYSTYGIEYDIYFTSDITWDELQDVVFTVYDSEGNVYVEAEPVSADRTNCDDGYLSEDGYYFIYVGYVDSDYLDAGTYYIDVYNPDGTMLIHDCCDVFD